MNDDQRALLYLFERPYERLNAPRGGGRILFQLPGEENEALATRFASMGPTILRVPDDIPNIMEDLHTVKLIPKGTPYSQFNSLHRKAAKELCQRFMHPDIINEKMLWQCAASVKDEVNEGLFIYALSFALIRNPAFDSRLIPAIYEVFPNKFIPRNIIEEADDQLRQTQYDPSESLPNIMLQYSAVQHDIDFTGTDLNPQHRVAYWCEDYGLNAHHWHWHLVFPFDDDINRDKEGEIIDRDRKGEIFFYMHNQMMARYDWERLSNNLNRVVKYNNWREPIPEGYFPKLTVNNSSVHYGGRPDNMTPQNFTRIDNIFYIPFDINDMERWRTRLFDAIHKGCMKDRDGNRVVLSDNVKPGEKRGIDILGDTIEADERLSVNFPFYGNLHNLGHGMLGFVHDPQGYHKEETGVVGDPSTSCRDPVFWRWHKFIDDVFQTYKMEQVPYKDNEIIFDSVKVESVSVKSDMLEMNNLQTGWAERSINASRGLDFRSQNREIWVNLQHLTYKPFTYNIQVTNNQVYPVDVTVRLYMAPMFNEAGKRMTFMDQRLLWAEMDKYKTTLEPGLNSLEKLSTESSITIPEELTFRDLEENPPGNDDAQADYCGCGWPQHLLLPKGRPGGMQYQILVLLSDWELDKVEGSSGEKTCSNAASYCGILNKKFPDARPMGYPFDRRIGEENDSNIVINNKTVTNFTKFASALSNAAITDITIDFRGDNLNLD